MQFLVSQCYCWEGYHLVQALLEDGHEVSGQHEESLSDREEHLSMYLGRHALFSEGIQKKDYDAHISFFGSGKKDDLAYRHVDISYEADIDPNIENQILLPILYGEWMPRDVDAIRWNGKRIPFEDDYFCRHALPVKPVMQTISKILSGNRAIEKYHFYAKEVCPEQEDRTVIALKRDVMDDLAVLHRHYEQYSRFYK
ncbi:hypothetical protein [Terribacillus sp. 7520-G]|uniref:hypothetical protein n=1 Tax=Terribacillus TaxID=459532 RepID=UPI000BA6EF25|nr:hypothetical protein [Terribacillus sp. 7520-G]PAD38248.1 hypothetical protein CHH53_12220 [Terribacillus sp. 7520-G]